MKSIVPYTKAIEFNTKIAEICSISLEHELNIGENEIEGNFIISGDYKSHEVSVNKEPFHYTLPFSLEVTENIDKETIDFEITDFTYEIEGDSTLKVNIEFCLTADELEEEKQKEEENRKEIAMEEIEELFNEPTGEESDIEEDRVDQESEAIILNSIQEKEEEFASYHIHIVNNTDSLESICAKYNTDMNTLKEYNTIDTISIGDKLIIPFIDE